MKALRYMRHGEYDVHEFDGRLFIKTKTTDFIENEDPQKGVVVIVLERHDHDYSKFYPSGIYIINNCWYSSYYANSNDFSIPIIPTPIDYNYKQESLF